MPKHWEYAIWKLADSCWPIKVPLRWPAWCKLHLHWSRGGSRPMRRRARATRRQTASRSAFRAHSGTKRGVGPGSRATTSGSRVLHESGFMLQPLVRRTWAPRGQTPIQYNSDRHDRLSVISALTVAPVRQRLGVYFLIDRDADSCWCSSTCPPRKAILILQASRPD